MDIDIEERNLTSEEEELIIWLLKNGEDNAQDFIAQLPYLKVVSKCGCGCASVNFSYKGNRPAKISGIKILSDYKWNDNEENLFGVFVFSIEKQLAGLEVWSIDGEETPTELPRINQLSKLDLDNGKQPEGNNSN